MYMRKVLCNDRSSFLEKVKIMFTEFDEFLLTCGYFKIRNWNIDSAEVISIDSGHYWIIKKFDKEMLLVLIGLVLIFKKQLTTLVNNIFQTISREAGKV